MSRVLMLLDAANRAYLEGLPGLAAMYFVLAKHALDDVPEAT